MKGIPIMSKRKTNHSTTIRTFIKENAENIAYLIVITIVTILASIFLIGPKNKEVEIEHRMVEDASNHLSKYYDVTVTNEPTDPYDNTSKIETVLTMTLKKKYQKDYGHFLDDKMVRYVKSVGKKGIRYTTPNDEGPTIGEQLWGILITKKTPLVGDSLSRNQFSPNTFSEIEKLFAEKSKLKQ